MDTNITETQNKETEKNILAGGDINLGSKDCHSPSSSKLVDLTDENPKGSTSGSTEDFEHVDHDPFMGPATTYNQPANKEKFSTNLNYMDDILGSSKGQFENAKTDFVNDFSQFASVAKEVPSNLMSDFDSKLNEKINQTKDFMAAERGFQAAVDKEKEQNKIESKPSAPSYFEAFENEPYQSSPVNKLIKEDNEKFISSEDLLGDFKEDRVKMPEPAPEPKRKDESEKVVEKKDASQPAKVNTETKVKEKPAEKPSVTPKPDPAEPVAPKIEPKKIDTSKMISAEEMFCRFGLVESLIYWRDVKKSGIVFGLGLIVLLAISCFSVISVFAYLSLLTLAGTIAFRIYKNVLGAVQKTSEGHPFKEYLEMDLALPQERVQQIVNVAVVHINGFTSELRRLFLVEDLVDSLRFGVILWILTYIGAWFNGMTLVILAFVALFTLPKVYENNKQSIDTYLDLVRSKFLEITDKVKAAVPIGKKPETDKDK